MEYKEGDNWVRPSDAKVVLAQLTTQYLTPLFAEGIVKQHNVSLGGNNDL